MLEGGKTNKEKKKKRIVERKEWDWLYVDTVEDVKYGYLDTLREEII